MNAFTHSCDPSPDMEEVWRRSLIRVTDEFPLPPVVLRVDDAIIGTQSNNLIEVTSQSYTELGQSYTAFFAILYSSTHTPIYLYIMYRRGRQERG